MKNVLLFFLVAITILSCNKNPDKPSLPVVTTTALSSVTDSSAFCGGTVTADGGSAVIARGICFSTSLTPSIDNDHTVDGNGTGAFSSTLTGMLLRGFTLHARAYATNSVGTAYGNEMTYTGSNGFIYIAGTQVTDSTRYAVVWKQVGSGPETLLSTGSPNDDAWSVYVSDRDYYVAGRMNNVATIWKNGVATALDGNPGASCAKAVYVKGTDIYAVGYITNATKRVATVWKNGIATLLTNGSGNAIATSIYISGADIYLAGDDGTGHATLWKNGIASQLTIAADSSTANCLVVNGTDVYVAGTVANIGGKPAATIWKNGVPTTLDNSGDSSVANSVYVFGKDVYVAGTRHDDATIWKNGVTTTLKGDGAFAGAAYSVTVFGANVYATGFYNGASVMWTNGIVSTLVSSSNNATGYSVFIP